LDRLSIPTDGDIAGGADVAASATDGRRRSKREKGGDDCGASGRASSRRDGGGDVAGGAPARVCTREQPHVL